MLFQIGIKCNSSKALAGSQIAVVPMIDGPGKTASRTPMSSCLQRAFHRFSKVSLDYDPAT